MKVIPQARRYLADDATRADTPHQVLAALPESGPIVLLAHSLGAVIAQQKRPNGTLLGELDNPRTVGGQGSRSQYCLRAGIAWMTISSPLSKTSTMVSYSLARVSNPSRSARCGLSSS
jgi:hypothetical protein